ncbi:MAG: helix-turn-helix domain-containing protein [Actinomycetota bacterium]|nr:helix-turn-helix domain-containing protein [Actinomycetota bacterium]MDQ2788364.1 helix-turn-helix domain-containing protein [Actinomycetota bacterium]
MVRRRILARQLRLLREQAGLTLEEAAPKLDWSAATLSRIETAQQSVDVHGVRSMLDLYDVGGDRWTELIELTRQTKQRGWWQSYGLGKQAIYVG